MYAIPEPVLLHAAELFAAMLAMFVAVVGWLTWARA
jgi:hypothetical protein